MIANRQARKCRVRTAHAALPSLAKAALTSRHCFNSASSWQRSNRVRSAHPTTVHTSRCHSRPRLKHSRAGYSGNPWGIRLRAERLNFEERFLAGAKWIPSPPSRGLKAAGMTGQL